MGTALQVTVKRNPDFMEGSFFAEIVFDAVPDSALPCIDLSVDIAIRPAAQRFGIAGGRAQPGSCAKCADWTFETGQIAVVIHQHRLNFADMFLCGIPRRCTVTVGKADQSADRLPQQSAGRHDARGTERRMARADVASGEQEVVDIDGVD